MAHPPAPDGRRRPDRCLLLLDFDGTLVPIARQPGAARLTRQTRQVLRTLAADPQIDLGFVSGRALADLRWRVGIRRAYYVGNHGLELRGRGVSFVHPQALRHRRALGRLAVSLRQALRRVPGALVEWKGLTISVHWRNVSRVDEPAFRSALRRRLQPLRREQAVRTCSGKRVIEIRPPLDWDKGDAVEWLWKRAGSCAGCLVYVGDDRTDEDAFRAVNRLRGVSVRVGFRSRASAARRRIGTPQELIRWLKAFSGPTPPPLRGLRRSGGARASGRR